MEEPHSLVRTFPLESTEGAAPLPRGDSVCPTSSSGKRNGFTIVRVALGVLLLTAAGLKLADGDFGAADGFGLLASPFWHLAVVEAEALLGV
jgi:hypothetical protein